MKTYAKLVQILNNREITVYQDARFLYELQQSVLLTLKDHGVLTEMQFQHAAEKLKEQLRFIVRGQESVR